MSSRDKQRLRLCVKKNVCTCMDTMNKGRMREIACVCLCVCVDVCVCVCVCASEREREGAMEMRVVNDDVSLSNNQLICSEFFNFDEKIRNLVRN